jgi:hypothetical protein
MPRRKLPPDPIADARHAGKAAHDHVIDLPPRAVVHASPSRVNTLLDGMINGYSSA